jgi:putative membrane protein
MSSPRPQKLFGTTNELAKERNRAAAERTMNTWIGNCLTFVSIGLAIDHIYLSLQQRFPDKDYRMTEIVAHITSLAFVGIGLALLIIAMIQHRLAIKTIEREDYVLLSISTLNRFVVAGIVLSGFLGFFIVLFLL